MPYRSCYVLMVDRQHSGRGVMLDLSRAETFRLREGGVACNSRGLAVGATPLLRAAPDGRWAVRPIDEINRELSAGYGLPVDVSGKAHGLASVARRSRPAISRSPGSPHCCCDFPIRRLWKGRAAGRSAVGACRSAVAQRSPQGLGPRTNTRAPANRPIPAGLRAFRRANNRRSGRDGRRGEQSSQYGSSLKKQRGAPSWACRRRS